MWFTSRQRNCNGSHAGERLLAPRSPRRRVNFRPRTDALDERCLLSFVLSGGYAVGANPQAIVTADVNGDGRLDLLTANAGSNSISVLPGLPSSKKVPAGTFAAARNYAVGPGPVSLAVGDFNGDGKPDIVAGVSGGMSVLLGNGDGTFQAARNSALRLGSYIAVADFNGDGKLDLLTNYDGVSVLLGNGDGTFRAGPTTANPLLSAKAVGDFNGDGKLDVIATVGDGINFADTSVGLLLGNGDGTFGAPQTIWTPSSNETFFSTLTVADFNHDGKLDVAVGWGSCCTNGPELFIDVLLGNGLGTFSPYSGGGATFDNIDPNTVGGLTSADFNHDGNLDLIVDSTGTSTVAVLFGRGDGGFGGPGLSEQTLPGGGTGLAVGDFNNDGYADVALVGGPGIGAGSIDVYLWTPPTTTKNKH
jgi:hypothetical protein